MRGARDINLKIKSKSRWARVQASVEAEKRRDSLDETPTTELARDTNLLI